MVTFTCQNCNSCLKKKAVDQHLFKCRNPVLTCIDCVKDFDCESYSGHVTCVTESERYGGQGYVIPSSMQKQNEWFSCISDVSNRPDISPPNLKKILKYASDFPTCPRNKKKFVNFILNNKTFSKFRGLADSAFDLISEEFNKKNAQSSESVNDENQFQINENTDNSIISKRKKISETEVPDETENNVTEKLSKKKDKKINGHVEHSNRNEENRSNEKKKKKKKNKKNSESRENEVESVENENNIENGESADNVENDEDCSISTESKKNKKKNKNRQNSTKDETLCETNGEINGHNEIEETCGDDHQNVNGEENSSNEIKELNGIDLTKLSKKERKKLLKQKKYEAEITSIENYKKEEHEESTEDTEKRKKKKQKHQNIDEEAYRKQKNSISEPDDKKIKLEDEEKEEQADVPEVIEKPKKFKWDEIIIQVLQTQDDGEISLKRLSKKICAEYANVYGERESYEEVLNKFNKKVLKTPGVRVHKDKAKLITSS